MTLDLICSVVLALRVDIVRPGAYSIALFAMSVRLSVWPTRPVGGVCENASLTADTHIGGAPLAHFAIGLKW